ncbi:MAG TPA: 16S rRNA (cytidine(1402)-2'-O)-methyltransferase [Candidatus Paceibacterota bacterium]
MYTQGKLSIVATPIGNLEDVTLRALRTLKEADVIYCEDTRVTKKLLGRYEITTPLRRLDANTEMKGAGEILKRLASGEHVAYCTDAGTPSISDPGYRLVAAVREAGFTVEAIPGPSALATALSIAGVPADSFRFFGFLPHKKGRQTLLKEIAAEERTIVLYESSHRILKLLAELAATIGERKLSVVREVTKKFEEVQLGTAADLGALFALHPEHTKGEFVIIVSPC